MAYWRKANPERTRATQRRFWLKHSKRLKTKNRLWRAANKDKVRKNYVAWVNKNRVRRRELDREWQRRNLDKAAMRNHRLRAAKRALIHPGIDKAKERTIYERCRQVSEDTGIVHHVDHIIPLAVGGWHHHLNLQILPHNLNLAKRDRLSWIHRGYKTWRDVPRFLWPKKLKIRS